MAGGGELAKAEAEQDAALDPSIDGPSVGMRCIWLGGADGAVFEAVTELLKGGDGGRIADGIRASGEMLFDLGVEIVLSHRESLARVGELAVSF